MSELPRVICAADRFECDTIVQMIEHMATEHAEEDHIGHNVDTTEVPYWCSDCEVQVG